MKLTIDIPDDFYADAVAAWVRLQERRAADQRQDLAFDDLWARETIVNTLNAIIVADHAETQAQAHQESLRALQERSGAIIREGRSPAK